MRPRTWNAPGRGSGAGAGAHRTSGCRPNRSPACRLAQSAPLALIDSLGDAQRKLQAAVVEALAFGVTCELVSRIIRAESALGAARHAADRPLAAGRASC